VAAIGDHVATIGDVLAHKEGQLGKRDMLAAADVLAEENAIWRLKKTRLTLWRFATRERCCYHEYADLGRRCCICYANRGSCGYYAMPTKEDAAAVNRCAC
jgi:hypothetical protein